MKRKLWVFLAWIMLLNTFSIAFSGSSHAEHSEGADRETPIRIIVSMEESSFTDHHFRGTDREESVSRFRNEAYEAQAELFRQMSMTAPSLEIRNRYFYLMNGFSAEVRPEELESLNDIPGVREIRVADIFQPKMSSSVDLIKANNVWNELDIRGEGTVVSVIDSGIDPEHGDMKLSKPTEARLSKSDISVLPYGKWFSSKIPFGYNYADKDTQIRDTNSSVPGYMHGMHVAGTVGANGKVKGVAPECQILAMKVFTNHPGSQGAYSDDIIRAIEDSVLLGADVINLSLGDVAGFYDLENPQERAIKKAVEQGVIVVTSAGNSTYSHAPRYYGSIIDDAVVGSPGLSPEVIAVASSENMAIQSEVFNLNIDGQYVKKIPFTSSGADPKKHFPDGKILFAGFGQPSDYENIDAKRNIIFVERGGKVNFEQKAKTALLKGAGALVVYNKDSDELVDMYLGFSMPIPALFIGASHGAEIKSAIENGKIPSLEFLGEMLSEDNPNRGQLSEFSSFGPTPNLDFKPDLTAPGGMIFSTLNEDEYGTMSGTSMASPHVAGAAALMKQRMMKDNRKLSDVEISRMVKNRLSSTAEPIISEDTSLEISPRRQGVGLINVYNAIQTKVVIESDSGYTQVSLKDFTSDEKTFSVTLRNLSDQRLSYTVDEDFKVLTGQKEDIDSKDGKSTERVAEDIVLERASISSDTSRVILEPFETKSVSFTLQMNGEGRNQYVEGFVRFVSEIKSEPSIGTAYIGYYGKWDELPILDQMRWEEPILKWQSAFLWNNNLLVDMGTYYNEAGQMLVDPQKLAMTTQRPKYSSLIANNKVVPNLMPLRNIKYGFIEIVDENKNTIKKIADYKNVKKYIRATNDIQPGYTHKSWIWDGTVYDPILGKNIPVKDGQYYFKISNRIDMEGASYQTVYIPIKVDNIKPTIKNLSIENGDMPGTYNLTFEATDDYSGMKGFYLVSKSNPSSPVYYDSSTISYSDFMPNLIHEPGTDRYTIRVDNLPIANQDYDLVAEDYAGNMTEQTVWLNNSSIKILSPDEGAVFENGFVTVKFEIPEEELSMADRVFSMVDMNTSTVKMLKKTDTEYTFFNLSAGKHKLTIGTTDASGASRDMNSVTVEIKTGNAGIHLDADSIQDGSLTSEKTVTVSGTLSHTPTSFLINDKAVPVDETLYFRHQVTLKEGRNDIRFEYITLSGEKIEYSVTVFLDSTAPRIELHSPTFDEFSATTVSTNYIELLGTVQDEVSGFNLFVNDNLELMRLKTEPGETLEKFNVRIPLKKGINQIQLRAVDALGNETVQNYQVNCTTNVLPPNYPEYFEGYQVLPEKTISNPQHTFTITFNQEIDPNSVAGDAVEVLDENLLKVEVDFEFSTDGQSISLSPRAPYEHNRPYYIVIRNVKNKNGKGLNQYVVMKFMVEN